jgi:hypothetical protein
VFLGLVTQRPAEIDPTIISQCSTMFVMRLSNERDQGLIRSAVSDAGANLLTFVPSLGTGEVFAFGAGVPLPTRMKFRELPPSQRPTSEAGGSTRLAVGMAPDRDMIGSVIDRWRAATMSHKTEYADDPELGSWRDDLSPRDEGPSLPPSVNQYVPAAPPLAPAPLTSAAPVAPAAEPPRHSILRRPLTASSPTITHAAPGAPHNPGPNNPAPLPSRYR